MPDFDTKSIKPFGRTLSIIAKSYLQLLNQNLNDLDIDRNYYALLLIETAEGDITQQELARLLDVDKVTMLRSIDYLSDFGYVMRVNNAKDRRKYSLVLTDKAHQALPKIKKAIAHINKIALNGFSEAEISDLLTKLQTIKKNINENTANL